MFLTYYNLKGNPFEKSMKKEEIFHSKTLKEFHSRMEYIKQYRGIILLTGQSGVGKTTAFRTWVEGLKPEFYKIVYLPLATVSTYDFYSQLNKGLGGFNILKRSDLFNSIQSLILDYATVRKRIPVIIFDEVHLLKSSNWYELQMILNFNLDSLDPAIVILCGHSLIRERLLRPALTSINNRLRLKYEFLALDKEETKQYISHHLKLVQADDKLFNDNAIEAIYNISAGVIRVINKLAKNALIYGALKRTDIITEDTIYKISAEL